MSFWEWFKEIGFSGILDMAIMSLLIYTILLWFKRTRAAFVLTGIIIVGGIYLFTRQFNLYMTAEVFEKFFAVILIALVVIFQEELRHFFERIAVWSLNRRLTRRKVIRLSRGEVEILVRTLTDLSRERIGALIVLRGRDMMLRHLEGGIDLHGAVSEPLLKSLFDPHSIGHDGAVVIEGNRIQQFACHLPLSKNIKKVGRGGTRHAAALGLSELCDALALVVSEERGTISVARHGDINVVSDPEKLTLLLERFYQEVSPTQDRQPWTDFFKVNLFEKVMAIVITFVLWLVLVYGAKTTYKTFVVPVEHIAVMAPWEIVEVQPLEVEVTFRGPRRAFYFLSRDRVKLFIKPTMKKGTQTVRISSRNLNYPKNIDLEVAEPKEVKIRMEQIEPEAKK